MELLSYDIFKMAEKNSSHSIDRFLLKRGMKSHIIEKRKKKKNKKPCRKSLKIRNYISEDKRKKSSREDFPDSTQK